MWNVVKLDDTRNWTELGTFNSVQEAKDHGQKLEENQEKLFYFFASEIPSEKAEQEKIANEVFLANDGKVLRLTIGLNVNPSSNKDQITSCGSCFCVVYTNGTRQCEGSYCNSNGYCWWVVCSQSC